METIRRGNGIQVNDGNAHVPIQENINTANTAYVLGAQTYSNVNLSPLKATIPTTVSSSGFPVGLMPGKK